jgi:CheY-like chemotaxis protein
VIELAWFAAGALAAVVAAFAAHAWRRAQDRANASPTPPVQPVASRAPCTVEARQLAHSIAEELANLSSGVEVGAHRLIEAAPDHERLPAAAEAMLGAVQRLRTMHRKLRAIAARRAATADGVTAIPPLLAAIQRELQAQQLGLEICHEPAVHLPAIAVPPAVAHDALLFLCASLLRAERGATHLAIVSEVGFASNQARVQLEFALEWIADAPAAAGSPYDDAAFALDLEAARQLITAHGGELALTHLPRRAVRAVVQWPVASGSADAGPIDVIAPAPAAAHRYGGALVLESDPSVRAMLASELKATGRAVFACADGASARTFLEATPDRFELLIVDDPQRLDDADALGTTIRTVTPDLKIFVLAPGRVANGARWPHLHHIQKPFGAHELRAALATVLAAG